MEESVIMQLIKAIVSGGPMAIVSLLISIIGYLIWEKKATQKSNKEALEKMAEAFASKIKEEQADLTNIIHRYQEGHISLLQAINEIRIIIATINVKIK